MAGATVEQCVILVGGLGTRLGALAADTPKPLLVCGDRPFLAWLMRECVRFGVRDFLLLTGHLAERVEDALPAIRASLPMAVTITLSREPLRAGTGGAVFHARHLLQERFLLCNGDSLLDGSLAALLAMGAAPAGRIVLRQVADAARYGVVTLAGARVTAFHSRPAAGGAGIINGGVYLLQRDAVLPLLTPVCALEADVLPVLAQAGMLHGVLCDGYFIDIGVPEDLARAKTELPGRLHRPALLLDRDGVMNRDLGWVGSRDRFEWMDGAVDAVCCATGAGWHVFVVTNQSGVARGLYDETAVVDLLGWMADTVREGGGTIDDFRYCPFHPQASVPEYRRHSDWRKPAPGMLTDLVQAWALDPARCHLIGDQPTDLQAAAAAGMAATLFTGGRLDSVVAPILQRGSTE